MERYSRQMLFQPIGEEGQEKLLNSRAVIVGMGALGTVIANHLVRSGIGYIRLIDRDVVELSNLQRQSLFDEKDAELTLPKVIAAEKKLKIINSTIEIEAVIADVNLDNAEDLLGGFDVILDGTDNFYTRYLINDVAIKYNIPWVHGAAVSSRGMFSVIIPGKTPCYRCLFPNVPTGLGETCDTVGVLSPLTDIIGSYQSMEAIKLLVGMEPTKNLEQIDIWYNSSLQMDVSDGRDAECPTCRKHQFEFLDRTSNKQVLFSTLCGRNTVQINSRNKQKFNMKEKVEQLKRHGRVIGNEYLIRFFPDEDVTIVLFKDGRVLIHGTNDVVKAKSYYAKFIGS